LLCLPIVRKPLNVSDPKRFDRLARRHRECLRGVRALKGSKEIAEELGIEKSTVDSYLTEAVRVLGAKNRRDAALMLAEHEDAAPKSTEHPEEIVKTEENQHPDKIGGDSARLVSTPDALPIPISPGEQVAGQPDGERTGPAPRPFVARLPFRRKGQADNELSVGDRLIWIQAIAVGTAIGFGMLAMGLQVVTTLIENVSRTLS